MSRIPISPESDIGFRGYGLTMNVYSKIITAMNSLIKLLFFFMLFIALTAPSGAEIVDGIIAEAGSHIITISDLSTEARISKIIKSEEGTITSPIRIPPIGNNLLEQIINRELVYQEAGRLKIFDENIDIIDEMLDFEKRFITPDGFNSFLKTEGISLDDLAERFLKEKTSRKFVEKKILQMSIPLKTSISDNDIVLYYNENIDLFGSRKIDDVKKEIRSALLNEKIEKELKSWLTDLKRRAKVKYVKAPGFQFQP